MNQIKNVVAVDRLNCNLLSGVKRLMGCFASVPDDLEWEHLKIQVPARLSINNKIEGKNTIWQSKLVFRTCQDLDTNGHWAYLVTLSNGRRLLMGGYERPYPVTTVGQTLPENMSDSQLLEVTVSLSSDSRLPVIP